MHWAQVGVLAVLGILIVALGLAEGGMAWWIGPSLVLLMAVLLTIMQRPDIGERPFASTAFSFALVLLVCSTWGPAAILLGGFRPSWFVILYFEAIAVAIAAGMSAAVFVVARITVLAATRAGHATQQRHSSEPPASSLDASGD